MNIDPSSSNNFNMEHAQAIDKESSVCYEGFSPTSRILKTPCKHLFHEDCLREWFKTELADRRVEDCPYCRKEMNGFEKKLSESEKLLHKYGNCNSLAIANRAIDEWNKAETSYEAIIYFAELCLYNSKESDDSEDANTLQKRINDIRIHGIIKNAIPIAGQPDMIRFEVAHKWLELWQQGDEIFTQRSPEDKAGLIGYIRGNLKYGCKCGLDQRVDELEHGLNKLLIQGIINNEIPIAGQPDMIRFEVARKWLELCQQGSEAFTQRSPDDKAGLIGYIRGNLKYGRKCGLDQRVNELEHKLNKLLFQGIMKKEIPIDYFESYEQDQTPEVFRFLLV